MLFDTLQRRSKAIYLNTNEYILLFLIYFFVVDSTIINYCYYHNNKTNYKCISHIHISSADHFRQYSNNGDMKHICKQHVFSYRTVELLDYGIFI